MPATPLANTKACWMTSRVARRGVASPTSNCHIVSTSHASSPARMQNRIHSWRNFYYRNTLYCAERAERTSPEPPVLLSLTTTISCAICGSKRCCQLRDSRVEGLRSTMGMTTERIPAEPAANQALDDFVRSTSFLMHGYASYREFPQESCVDRE
jgi:hypothetical protein